MATAPRDGPHVPMPHDITHEQPERFKRAVRAACCDVCDWPECRCKTTADIARKAINEWNYIPVDLELKE